MAVKQIAIANLFTIFASIKSLDIDDNLRVQSFQLPLREAFVSS